MFRKSNTHSIVELMDSFSITERQVRYEIKKINYFLKENSINEICLEKGNYSLCLEEQEWDRLQTIMSSINTYEYVMSSEERRDAILLLLINAKDYLTSQSFADYLNVSKRSIDNDIKKLKTEVRKWNLNIVSQQSKGCRLEGNEVTIRNLCVKLLHANISSDKGGRGNESPIDSIIHEVYCDNYLGQLLEIINNIERNEIHKEITYDSKFLLILYLLTMIKRIEAEHYVKEFPTVYGDSPNSRKYAMALKLATLIENSFSIRVTDSEKYVIAMYLEGVQYVVPDSNYREDWSKTVVLVSEIIRRVSKIIDVDLSIDKDLFSALQAHMIPTSFKIQNNLQIKNPQLDEIKEKYSTCYRALKDTLLEIDSPLINGITDDEIGYMVLHFCAAIERRKRMMPSARVAVVCLYGAATSRLLRETLLSKFPNLSIEAIVSQVDLNALKKLNIDFIISSVDLRNTEIPVVVVNPILDDNDLSSINRMIKKYSGRISNESFDQKLYAEIIEKVSHFIEEEETESFSKELAECFKDSYINGHLQAVHPRLKELLDRNHIRIGETASNWKEAVKKTSIILEDMGEVDNDFVESAISSIVEVGPYVVITDGVALVHNELGHGVKSLSMAMATFPEGVSFSHSKYDPVYIIFALAAIDFNSHVEALQDLLNILENYNAGQIKDMNKSEILELLAEGE